jgi:hypothetical protein
MTVTLAGRAADLADVPQPREGVIDRLLSLLEFHSEVGLCGRPTGPKQLVDLLVAVDGVPRARAAASGEPFLRFVAYLLVLGVDAVNTHSG